MYIFISTWINKPLGCLIGDDYGWKARKKIHLRMVNGLVVDYYEPTDFHIGLMVIHDGQ